MNSTAPCSLAFTPLELASITAKTMDHSLNCSLTTNCLAKRRNSIRQQQQQQWQHLLIVAQTVASFSTTASDSVAASVSAAACGSTCFLSNLSCSLCLCPSLSLQSQTPPQPQVLRQFQSSFQLQLQREPYVVQHRQQHQSIRPLEQQRASACISVQQKVAEKHNHFNLANLTAYLPHCLFATVRARK